MGRSATNGTLAIRESIGNYPLSASKQAFLEAFFENGGDATGAAKSAFPRVSNAYKKGRRLRGELAPYVVEAALDYQEKFRPVTLHVLGQFVKGDIEAPASVRLNATLAMLERLDRMVDPDAGGTKGKDTLDGLIGTVLKSFGAELARQILTASGIPGGKVDEVLAQLTGPKVVPGVVAEADAPLDLADGGPELRRTGADTR